MAELLLIIILILINAFFAASEMAIVSLNRTKITHLANEENKKAKTLLKLMEEPSKFLATIQVGITMAGFLASASAATSMSKPLAKFLLKLNIPGSDQIALFLVTIILAYITLVLGELVPKRIALQNSERIAMASINIIIFISKITLPFVKILTASTNLIMRILGNKDESIEEKVSKEEIMMMIDVGEETGILNQTEKEMIDGIFDFDDTLAKEVMTPRTDVFAVDIDTPIEELINKVMDEQFSRIPVYEGDIDNIIGILYLKDLFIYSRKEEITKETLIKILRTPYFVPETKNIDELFRELQSNKNHMAILIDEYGGFSGIVTIEDLIEEIVGNIFDEYDDIVIEDITKVDTNTYIVNGATSIDDINETLHINLPSDNYDTIGGFVIDILGSIPKEDEHLVVEYENLTFEIEKVEEKRIEKLKICIN
ncbi:putative hemolysin [Clostridium sp. USBA 49]|uniref:hemolysin family protein n=1 Tax=Clostridium sp. USBA 49 TaxID=1881060 RepID=UPI0009992DC0|nr:hemolysin family protein [Clostridium sp. USBA 49]SKA78949.1 putative hemolysin [Clostridium sp. USBA 49]